MKRGAGAIYVYRLFDAHGDLLYVGCSNNLLFRQYIHGREKEWFPDVATWRLVGPFLSRAGAEAVERQAIQTEKPRHNVMHTARHAEQVLMGQSARMNHLLLLRAEAQHEQESA